MSSNRKSPWLAHIKSSRVFELNVYMILDRQLKELDDINIYIYIYVYYKKINIRRYYNKRILCPSFVLGFSYNQHIIRI